MKRTFVLLLSILLIAGLSMISCQKKDADTETTGYGEQAGELMEQAGEAVEEAADTVVESAEKAGEAVEEAADTAIESAEEAGEEAGKAIEGLGK